MTQEKRNFGKWWIYITVLVILSSVMIGIMSYFGKVGSTIVERKVFEESYQRTEGLRTQIYILEEQISELDLRLNILSRSNDSKDKQKELKELMDQKSMVIIRLRTAKRRLNKGNK